MQYRRNEAFTLEHRPIAPASECTVEIISASGTVLLAAEDVVLGEVSSTGSTVRDSPVVELDLAAVVPAGDYWIQRPPGDGYPVEVRGVVGDEVHLRDGALEDEDVTLLSWVMSHAVAAIDGTYRSARVIWRYSVGGVAQPTEEEIIDIVRLPFRLAFNQRDVARVEPEFRSMAGSLQEFWQLRDTAELEVMQVLRGWDIEADLVIDRRLLELPAIYTLLQFRHKRDTEQAEFYSQRAADAFDRFRQSNSWYDGDGDMERAMTYSVDADGIVTETVEETMPIQRMVAG